MTTEEFQKAADRLREHGLPGTANDVLRALHVYQAELAACQEENKTLRAAQKACETCDAPTMQEVDTLRAQNRELREALAIVHADAYYLNLDWIKNAGHDEAAKTVEAIRERSKLALAQTEVKP